jgi:hypothetical protein
MDCHDKLCLSLVFVCAKYLSRLCKICDEARARARKYIYARKEEDGTWSRARCRDIKVNGAGSLSAVSVFWARHPFS